MKSAEWANTKTKANMKLQFCRIFIAVSNLVTALCAAEIAARKIQSVAPNASGPQMPIYNVCAAAAEAHACGRARGPFAPRANGNTEKATLVRRLSRARSRGGGGEIAWESTAGMQRPGAAVASSNLSKALTIPSLSAPPSVFNSLLSTAAGQGTCRTCLISSKETGRT